MKRKIMLLAGGLLSLTSLGAQAQAPGVQLNMDSGVYIGAGGGGSRATTGCATACDKTDKTWNVFVGYQLNRNIGIEVGYADFGSLTTGGTLFGVPSAARTDTTAWDFTLVGTLPITDRFSFYGKLGVFRYDSDATMSGAATGTASAKGTAFTIGGGVQYAFTGNIAGRFEWQHYNDVGNGVPGLAKDDISVWRVTGRYKF
jgi:OOP family OmpA-OmpF porin